MAVQGSGFRQQKFSTRSTQPLDNMQTDGYGPVLGMIGLARRAGRVVLGRDETLRSLEKGKARAVVIACDAGNSLKHALSRALEQENPPPMIAVANKDSLGHALGRSTLGVLAITDEGFARQVRTLAQTEHPTVEQAPRAETK